jgi:DNA-binding transcriptional LysR family regulator
MQDLNDLYYFVHVVEHDGYAAAGRALGMPRSKLSRRIMTLEERLGVRLLQRSTRKLTVTEIGQEYYRHCVAMLAEAAAAEEAIERSRAEPQGLVRISAPPALVCFEVGPMIARYMAAHPRVTIELESTSRRVDVIGEGIDVALRVRFPPLEQSELVMRTLGESPQRMVASPNLVKGMTLPLVPADVDPHIAAGELVDVTPGWTPRGGIVHAVFPTRRGLLPSVRGLIDFLVDEYARVAAKTKAQVIPA